MQRLQTLKQQMADVVKDIRDQQEYIDIITGKKQPETIVEQQVRDEFVKNNNNLDRYIDGLYYDLNSSKTQLIALLNEFERTEKEVFLDESTRHKPMLDELWKIAEIED